MPIQNRFQHKFTTHLKKTLKNSYQIAWSREHKQIRPEHLLWALAKQKGSIAFAVLQKANITPEFLEQRGLFPQKPHKQEPASFTYIPKPSPFTKKILKQAILLACRFQHRYIGTEHLLSAILKQKTFLKNIIPSDPELKLIQQYLHTILKSTSKFPEIVQMTPPAAQSLREEAEEEYEEEISFGQELTDKEIQQNIDPVICREKEIERVAEILLRRAKNNPLLIGEPGVGKTAIIEGLSKMITEEKAPHALLGKKIFALDMGLLLSGAIYRGEFEARLKQIIEEAQKDPDFILFIDEIHTVVGAGATSGSIDAANLLKPALAKGQIRCIGATTFSEYRKNIENDPALERRFQIIRIEEPLPKQAKNILRGIRPYYEAHHDIKITDSAIEAAVEYAKQYLPKRFFPDKAIDLIDEACSKKQLQKKVPPQENELRKIRQKLDELQTRKKQAVEKEQFEKALLLRNQCQKKQKEYTRLEKQIRENQKNQSKQKITFKEIAEVVSHLSQVPKEKILEEQGTRIHKLASRLKKNILGQDSAIDQIVGTLKKNWAGLGESNKPAASFLFAGPSGVGKTWTAKKLSECLFGNPNQLIQIDMSEYSEKFHVSKLLGAPAGYVGYEQNGLLSNKLFENPHSIILFDEFEKAHPDVRQILFQILDEGKITDAQGKNIHFNNNILILSTHLQKEAYHQNVQIGFLKNSNLNKTSRENSLAQLKKNLNNELLTRLDQIVFFDPLTSKDLKQILKNKITEIKNRLQEQQQIKLKIQPRALEQLSGQYLSRFNPTQDSSARPIQNFLEESVQNKLADILLNKKNKKGGIITMKIKNGRVYFTKK